MQRDDPNGPSGRYLVLYEGQGQLDFDFSSSIVQEEPGRILIDVLANQTSGILLKILYTNPDDPIRNVRIVMPGEPKQSSAYLSSEFPVHVQSSFIDRA